MDSGDFDDLSRRLASAPSRRSVLKGVGALLVGGLVARGEPAAAANSTCAQFCAATFGADTAAAKQCTSEAAKGRGLCYTCGPKSAGGTQPICCTRTASGVCANYSGAACCGTTTVCVNGTCTTCPDGYKQCNGQCIRSTSCCNGSCPTGYTCINGGCFKKCETLGDCGAGCSTGCQCFQRRTYDPEETVYCLDSSTSVGTCASDADCPSGSLCSGFSIPGPGAVFLCTYPCPC